MEDINSRCDLLHTHVNDHFVGDSILDVMIDTADSLNLGVLW